MATTKVTDTTLHHADQYDAVRFVIFDLYGVPRGRTVFKKNLARYLREGIDLYYGCLAIGPNNEMNFTLPGIPESHSCNVTLLPAEDRIHELLWAGGEFRVGEILCETVYKGEYQSMNPRTVCRKQLQRLDKLGLTLKSSFECEFTLYDYQDPKKPLFETHSFLGIGCIARYEKFFLDINKQLSESDIAIDAIHCEYSSGQIEVILTPTYGLEAADITSRFKEAVKEICENLKFAKASFMTKGLDVLFGNAFHYNHSLWDKDKKSALYDPNTKDMLTDTAQQWLGGLLKHARAITVLCAPTFNCYRRLQGPATPGKSNWGIDNRNVSFRVKNNGPDGTYFENRLPSSACCPYLVIAATVAAGIDGIMNKINLPKEADSEAEEIPKNFEEALVALQEDSVLCEALGKEFIDWFVPLKQDYEPKKFEKHNIEENIESELDYEREVYFFNI